MQCGHFRGRQALGKGDFDHIDHSVCRLKITVFHFALRTGEKVGASKLLDSFHGKRKLVRETKYVAM